MGKLVSIFFPVRKGSKRITNKNTRSIKHFKKGLLEIKINQLKKLKNEFKNKFTKHDLEIIFSTNCEKTKFFLKNYNWIKVLDRKRSLSTDDVLDKLIVEVPRLCKGEIIFWSHVTSPLFNEKCYLNFFNIFFKNIKNFDSAFSASKIDSYVMNEKNKWISHDTSKKKWPRTQDLKKLFMVNNAIFGAKRFVYTKYKNRLGKKILPILTSKYNDLDVDIPEDLEAFKKFI